MSLWKDYSLSYVKANKTSTISIIIAAFVSSLLLSLICGIFYNIRADEIRLIQLEEGNWHGKITGSFSDEVIDTLENHPDIKEVILQREEEAQGQTIYLSLYHPERVYRELSQLVEQLGLDTEEVQMEYHDKLLTQYFIFAEGHNPPLILFVYLFTLLLASISLIMVIHNAFGVSMIARLHQLGILQSIGATPGQLRAALINEAVILCVLPIISGVFAGAGLCYTFMMFVRKLVQSVREYDLIFQYHPAILLTAFCISFLTVWFSARIPARKLSRLSPLEAIRYEGEQVVNRSLHSSIAAKFFGVEGELAHNSLRMRRKAYRTSTISLTLSFLVFSAFLNLEAISGISTKHTYFERYKNTWDLMITVENPEGQQGALLAEIRNLSGVTNCISYQKAHAYTVINEDMLSDELLQLGGLHTLTDDGLPDVEGNYQVNAPLLILDDESFLSYEQEIRSGDTDTTDMSGVIIVNTIWDSSSSNYRYKKMIPFLRPGATDTLELVMMEVEDGGEDKKEEAKDEVEDGGEDKTEAIKDEAEDGAGLVRIKVRITATAESIPRIREEFDNYSLIQVMPETAFQAFTDVNTASACYFTILAESEDKIEDIQRKLMDILGERFDYTLENKAESEANNIRFRNAYKIVVGSLAGLLVCIGLANVLSNSLGMIYQRKRELARYFSIGLSPKGEVKLIMLEATILAVKPILISLLVNIPLVILSLRASYISTSEFLEHIPILPIGIFAAVLIVTVEAAYYLGGRRIYRIDLVEALKDDTLE